MKQIFNILAATAVMLLAAACSRGGDAVIPEDTIVRVGSDFLRAEELRQHIPSGISHDDSVALARAYIHSWIDTRLIAKVAAEEVDIDEIERLTAEYRNELIMSQYRRAMARQASDGIFAEDSLQGYYEACKADFVLERPMVKGIYLKVPQDASNLAAIRKLYKSERRADIDRLEKEALSAAIHYDFFRDRWIDWEQIETRIPVDFTASVTTALEAHKPLEVTAGGFVYLLSVSDYLPAGATMPFEAAKPIIKERLLSIKRIAYDAALRNDLLNRALSDGTVSFPGQNPLK
ncbi:MAG: peptidyl-prolyl cis-trans isomerase [Muribaculaceae bacterium]|nr:peptidyl-prolyl cis-trans isomerase [Muribaculaceae bacterium]